nr:reverse transcriptase domain-containing protein [Tanacetum cinerariifolium]
GATSNPNQAPSTTTTTVTNAQFQAMIDQCVNAALAARALTWWNSHVRIVGNDAAYVMTLIELKKKRTNKYCPRNEMKKIETEFWKLEVQGTDVMRQDVARAYAAGSGNRQQSLTNANVANNQRGNGAGQKVTCYECGEQGHFKRYGPKLKNNDCEMGSFDVRIGMDWLSRYRAVIVCANKIVRVPWGRETLIFHGDGSNQEHEAR